jgi:hypothetical protein
MQITPALIEQTRAKIKHHLKRANTFLLADNKYKAEQEANQAEFYAGMVVLYRVGLGEIQVKLKHPAKALRKI